MTRGGLQIVLFGAGEHARVVADIAASARHRVVAVVDDDPAAGAVAGIAVRPDAPAAAAEFPAACWCVAIGDNDTRSKVVARLERLLPQLRFAALVHASATVAPDIEIAPGSVVMAGAVMNPGTRIGRHCIVNTGACLDHDNVLEDFSSVAPGVVTGGKVRIGSAAAVCIGAVISHGLTIGARTIIGAGATVLSDIPAASVAFGLPARVVRARGTDDRYL